MFDRDMKLLTSARRMKSAPPASAVNAEPNELSGPALSKRYTKKPSPYGTVFGWVWILLGS